jgi:hypothetical protein
MTTNARDCDSMLRLGNFSDITKVGSETPNGDCKRLRIMSDKLL